MKCHPSMCCNKVRQFFFGERASASAKDRDDVRESKYVKEEPVVIAEVFGQPSTTMPAAEGDVVEIEVPAFIESSIKEDSTETTSFTGEHTTTMTAAEKDVRDTEVSALIDSIANQDSPEITQDLGETSTVVLAAGEDVTEMIEPNVNQNSAEITEDIQKWKIALGRHYDFLVERISIDFGLLDKLRTNGSISYEEIQKIKAPLTVCERNRRLLDIIGNRNKHHELIGAFKSSGQTHLVNYLENDGSYGAKFRGDWPLRKVEILILDSNFENLVDLLDTCDLLDRLSSTSVINVRQQEFINSKPTSYEKNEALLDVLRRCSLDGYRQTIRCLHASNQSHIARILEKGGVLLRVDAEVRGVGIDVNEVEDEIVAGITNLLGNRSLPESNRIWELVQLNLIAVRRGHSVDLYFVCHQVSDFDRFQQMIQDGRLRETIQAVFSRLITNSAKIRFKLKPTTFDFKKSQQYIKDIIEQLKNDKTITDLYPPAMSNLPFDLLDSILLKSYLEHVLKENQVRKNKDYDIISQLASVDSCWFKRIRRRKFKKEMWRRLIEFYRKQQKPTTFYRTNQQYLEENIRLKDLVNRTKSIDCLTDVQAAFLVRQNLASRKKDSFQRFGDLISEVAKKTQAIHSVFRQYTRQIKYHLIGEVIENGGAVVKVEIKLQTFETRHQNLQFVERIKEMRDSIKIRSTLIEEPLDELKHDNLEILSAGQDGDVFVVWIWCQTKCALEKLQTLNKSKNIIDVFTELVENLSFSSKERNAAMVNPKLNIDFEQFEKTIVDKPGIAHFSIVANFTTSLDLKRTKDENVKKENALDVEEVENVWGVTKLRNKIHVLLHRYAIVSASNCVILVFEDQLPFHLLQKIEIKEIEDPREIAASEMENSLYVLDISGKRKCVWKRKEENEEEVKLSRWLELRDYYTAPRTLSVTRDGQLLLVGRRKDDGFCSLRTFGEGESNRAADPRLSIPLPEDIRIPRHAVETSKGNFILLHSINKMKKKTKGGSDAGRRQKEEEDVMVVSEVSGDGKTILRRFIPKNEEQKLSSFLFGRLAVDSQDRLFLTDHHRVVVFDSDFQWNEILIPTEEDEREGRKIWRPRRLFYDKGKKELIVGGAKEVFVYTLNRK